MAAVRRFGIGSAARAEPRVADAAVIRTTMTGMGETSKTRRRWLRFSLRTTFIVTTAVAVWLGYEWNWVRQRRAFLQRPGVQHVDPQLLLHQTSPPYWPLPPAAPGLLWLFGEQGIGALIVPIEAERFDESLPPDSYEEVRTANRLFPEGTVIEIYPFSPADP